MPRDRIVADTLGHDALRPDDPRHRARHAPPLSRLARARHSRARDAPPRARRRLHARRLRHAPHVEPDRFAHARDRYVWSLSQQEYQSRQQAEREIAEQLAETGRVLASEIDGWSPEVAGKLVEYAGAFGVTLDELREVADPRLWKILHRAHLGDEMVKQQEMTKQAEQLQSVRPAVQVSGGASVAGGVRDELGTGEWMRRRGEQAMKGR